MTLGGMIGQCRWIDAAETIAKVELHKSRPFHWMILGCSVHLICDLLFFFFDAHMLLLVQQKSKFAFAGLQVVDKNWTTKCLVSYYTTIYKRKK